MESVKRFKETHGAAWTIRWHPGARTPSIIYGSKTKPDQEILSSNGDEKVARKFFSSFRDLFKIRNSHDDWLLEKRVTYAGMKYIGLAQTYRGIKVYTGSYTVTLEPDGGIRTITGKFFPDIDIDVRPSITPPQALQKACEYLQIPPPPGVPQLVIYPTELGGLRYRTETYVLAYEMDLSAQNGSWHTLVDAQSGEIIRSESTVCHASGNIYLIDPGNTPNLTTVTLPRLSAQSKLEGQYVRVFNYNGINYNPTQAYEPSGNFLYNASDGRLDEVNAYYHADAYFNWFINTFPGALTNTTRFDVWVHYNNVDSITATANIRSIPQRVEIADGDGWRLRMGQARKNDIIYHEVQHIVTSRIGIPVYDLANQKMLHEGYSDYFAASYTNDSIIGEWLLLTNTGHLRTVYNDPAYFNYPNLNYVSYGLFSANNQFVNSNGTQHAQSMIWSGALWDLRTALGRNAAGNWISDELIVKAIKRATPAIDYFSSIEDIVSSDYEAPYYGAHEQAIRNVFDRRHFSEPSLVVTGPECLCPGETGTYSVSISGALLLPIQGYQWSEAVPCLMPQLLPGEGDCDVFFDIPGAQSETLNIQTTAYKTLRIKVKDYNNRGFFAFITINMPPGNMNEDPRCNCGGGGSLPKTPVRPVSGMIPERFDLRQNYPNPFNPATTIKFSIPEPSTVLLKIYNIQGQEIGTLVNEYLHPGEYDVAWDGTDGHGNKVASGLYIYRIQAGNYVQARKMIYLK